jgi:hypothetical protein
MIGSITLYIFYAWALVGCVFALIYRKHLALLIDASQSGYKFTRVLKILLVIPTMMIVPVLWCVYKVIGMVNRKQ